MQTEKKTFFFRNNEYSIDEMIERIYAENFIEFFKGYLTAETKQQPSKKNCLLGLGNAYPDDEDTVRLKITQAFEEIGRKGDKLSVNLFRLTEVEIDVTPRIKSEIEDLITTKTNIRNRDSLSRNLEYDLFLENVNYNQSSVDFRFRVDKTEVVTNPIPTQIIKSTFVEVRLYTATKLAAMYKLDITDTQAIQILSVVSLLFKRYTPRIEKISLDEAQLIMINLKLKGLVSSPKFKSDDDLRVDIYGVGPQHQNNNIMQFIEGSSSLKMYELAIQCIIEGHACNLKLTNDGGIYVGTPVNPKVLDFIILQLNWVIHHKKFYNDIEQIMIQTFKRIKPSILQYHLATKIKKVEEDLKKVVEGSKLNVQKRKLLFTVLTNLGLESVMMLEDDQILNVINEELKDEEINIDNYGYLKSFFSDYFVSYRHKNRTDSDDLSKYVVILICSFYTKFKDDVVGIIEEYKIKTEEWSECLVQRTS
ncbi:hypothetical protein [Bacillus sp. NPDC057893]|uniref:hypothetical protein n=1 Tax=Bacillus sp. NPDC057893 TaxID=3346273 RepID=UPI00366FBFE9